MDRAFKIAVILIFAFAGVSTLLVKLVAGIRLFSREFLLGFLPFMLLLVPYILFSSDFFVTQLRKLILSSVAKKLLFPLYVLLVYTLFSAFYSTFQWENFLRLSMWLAVPTLILSSRNFNSDHFPFQEFFVVLLLWLPVEFNRIQGFNIIFTNEIQIPALAFAAPALGLYLFRVLKNLPDIGFEFCWKMRDLLKAGLALLLLAFLLIPMGTQMGFIRLSVLQVSSAEVLKLLFGIYFLVALPEELLFRGIIQNLFSKIFSGGQGNILSLAIASVIFGLAHLNNFSPPDWRYVFLATIAGLFYGWTYMQTGKTTVSALVHCGVNFFWAILFKDTAG